MNLYVVRRYAVYQHEIGGVFTTLELATECAVRLMLAEPDNHHDYAIAVFTLDACATGERDSYGSFLDGPVCRELTWIPGRSVLRRRSGPFSREDIMIKDVT